MAQLVGEFSSKASTEVIRLGENITAVERRLENSNKQLSDLQAKSDAFATTHAQHMDCYQSNCNPIQTGDRVDVLEKKVKNLDEGIDASIKGKFNTILKVLGISQAIYLLLFGFLLYKLFEVAKIIGGLK